uniref:Uncharacterized protein n=1 Tax=Arundo donax TaxID=35708 RepID=A0A0A8Z3W4_ARUDO
MSPDDGGNSTACTSGHGSDGSSLVKSDELLEDSTSSDVSEPDPLCCGASGLAGISDPTLRLVLGGPFSSEVVPDETSKSSFLFLQLTFMLDEPFSMAMSNSQI